MSQTQVNAFGGIWNKRYAADSQNQNANLSFKANLDDEIFFGNIFRLIEAEIRKMLEMDLYRNQHSTFHSGP